VTVTIPEKILRAFPAGEKALDRRVNEALVLQLYREREISAGRVAELLGIYRTEADQLLSENGLQRSPSEKELRREKATTSALSGLNFRIERSEFRSGVFDFELPVHISLI
jgi:predicted HTH domain antitoxin